MLPLSALLRRNTTMKYVTRVLHWLFAQVDTPPREEKPWAEMTADERDEQLNQAIR